MFSHITIGVNDLAHSISFYDVILSQLGLERHSTEESFAGYGEVTSDNEEPDNTGVNSLWIMKPSNGKEAKGGNGTNIALLAESRDQVDAFYTAAINLGAINDGAPAIRNDAHDNFYACYVIDFDGNKLVAVCHKRE
ncbi:MAG: VOC family protein [Hyphomonadaceae bacterium]|nr:VOC family protein [Hyphomonadaceae bacterium]